MQHESMIKDLNAELNRLQERIGVLESARRALESQNSLMNEEQGANLRKLEQVKWRCCAETLDIEAVTGCTHLQVQGTQKTGHVC